MKERSRPETARFKTIRGITIEEDPS